MAGQHHASRLLLFVYAIALLLHLSIATGTSTKARVTTLYQFPDKGTWLENLAVRKDGRILATRLDQPELYQFTIGKNGQATPQLLHTFKNATGMTGIAEIEGFPDTFAVLVGNFSLEKVSSTPGSWSVHHVDLTSEKLRITKLADIPQAVLPNGMVSLKAKEQALLVADSEPGNVWRFDLRTSTYRLAINDPLMRQVNSSVPEGINGLKRHGSTLLYTNAYAPFLAEIPIFDNGTASGKSKIVARSVRSDWTFDDMAVSDAGVAYVATGYGNSITRITPRGAAAVIAGNVNSTEIAEPTSLAFGRTAGDLKTLYITTGGALGDPVNGSIVVGAQLLALRLE